MFADCFYPKGGMFLLRASKSFLSKLLSKEDNRMFTVFFPSSPPFFFFFWLTVIQSCALHCLGSFVQTGAMVGHLVNSPKKQYICLKILIAQIWNLERIGMSDGKHT